MSRNPNLPHRRIGTDDKLGGRIIELNGQRPGIEVSLKGVPVGGEGKPTVKVGQSGIGERAKFLIVHRLYQDSAPRQAHAQNVDFRIPV
jgi:hypothetical protein